MKKYFSMILCIGVVFSSTAVSASSLDSQTTNYVSNQKVINNKLVDTQDVICKLNVASSLTNNNNTYLENRIDVIKAYINIADGYHSLEFYASQCQLFSDGINLVTDDVNHNGKFTRLNDVKKLYSQIQQSLQLSKDKIQFMKGEAIFLNQTLNLSESEKVNLDDLDQYLSYINQAIKYYDAVLKEIDGYCINPTNITYKRISSNLSSGWDASFNAKKICERYYEFISKALEA